MNSRNSETSYPYRLLLNLSDNTNLKRSNKYVTLSDLGIYYMQENKKKSDKNNKFEISAPTWNDKLELLDGLYSVSNIQGYFECILF